MVMMKGLPSSLKTGWGVLLMLLIAIILPCVYLMFPFNSQSSFQIDQLNEYFLGIFGSKAKLQFLRNGQKIAFNYTKLTDWKTCSFSPTSTFRLVKKKNSYKIGETVTVHINAKDYLGRRKERGGDVVRIWVKDTANGACSAGYVTDNNDGTYLGHVQLLWAGNVTITARIVAPRETVGMLRQNLQADKAYRHMIGIFKRGKVTEKTWCTPRLDVSTHYHISCNLSKRNSDLPWFCEKPHDLSCQDWSYKKYEFINVTHTSQENEMLKWVHKALNMNTTIQLTVDSGTTQQGRSLNFNNLNNISLPCNRLPPRSTWIVYSPVGYMYKDKWHSTQCNNTFDGSVSAFKSCLKGRKLWLFGDSTSEQFFKHITKLLKMRIKVKNHEAVDEHFSISFIFHALPLFSHIPPIKAPHLVIDSIPANSRDIILVHFFLHFAFFPPDVVKSHLRKTAKSLKALKARAPETVIFVKGPHTFHTPTKGTSVTHHLYDFFGVLFDKIYREEFGFMLNDLIFLDVWDITLATESSDFHPKVNVMKPLINYMMSFACA